MTIEVGIDWGDVKSLKKYKNLPDTAKVRVNSDDFESDDPEDYEVGLWAAAMEAVTEKFGVEPNEIKWVR